MKKSYQWVVAFGLALMGAAVDASACPRNSAVDFCVGDSVITSDFYRGTVVAAFRDGQVSLRLDGFSGLYKRDAATLARTDGCKEDVCVGDDVITSDLYQAKVQGIFRDNRLALSLSGFSGLYSREIQTLAYVDICKGGFCVGDRVITNDQYQGVIRGFFRDNRVALSINGFSGLYIRDIGNLASTEGGCSRGHCVGDTVISQDLYRGRIVAVFPQNGQASLALDGFSGTYSRDLGSLGSTRGCTRFTDICVGDRVITADNYSGKVIAIFRDGVVALSLDGFSGLYRRDSGTLGVTTSCPDPRDFWDFDSDQR